MGHSSGHQIPSENFPIPGPHCTGSVDVVSDSSGPKMEYGLKERWKGKVRPELEGRRGTLTEFLTGI